jgi:glycosyltransferase involved in cell wall biosynthesis
MAAHSKPHAAIHVASVFPKTSNRLALQCDYTRDNWNIELLHLRAKNAASATSDNKSLRTYFLPQWPDFRAPENYLTRRFRSLVRRIVNFAALHVMLFRSRADLLHAHENSSLWALAFWVLILRRPAVWDPHDFFHTSLRKLQRPYHQKWQMFLERAIVGHGTPVITVSEGMQERYRELFPDAQVIILRNYSSHRARPVDSPDNLNETALRLVKHRNRIAGGTIRLVYPGLIKPDRFSLELIKQLGTTPGVSLDIYGEDRSTTGVNLSALEKLMHDKQISNVRLRGRYTSDSIVPILGNYHFVILPYKLGNPNIDFCLPNKFYQCIEAGLPLITSDMKEMGGIISRFGLGYVFSSDDELSCLSIITESRPTDFGYLDLVRNVLRYQLEEVDYHREQSLLHSIYAQVSGK